MKSFWLRMPFFTMVARSFMEPMPTTLMLDRGIMRKISSTSGSRRRESRSPALDSSRGEGIRYSRALNTLEFMLGR